MIKLLRDLDRRFVYISPFVTRDLRSGEDDKIAVTAAELDALWSAGRLLTINDMYGVRYGTPKGSIEDALADGRFPLLDWPIAKVDVMVRIFAGRLRRTYIEPRDNGQLVQQLTGRDGARALIRIETAESELKELRRGAYDGLIDFRIVNEAGRAADIAGEIYLDYLRSLV